MYDRFVNRRESIHTFTHDYARLADLVEAIDDPRNIATSHFSEINRGLVRALGLDSDSTPDEVIVAVYAYYRAHGGEATERMICGQPSIAFDFFAHFAMRPTHPIA